MKALPPIPERKLLTDGSRYSIGCDLASGLDMTVIEKWWDDGRYEVWVDGTLVDKGVSPYWHGKPPYVPFVSELPEWMKR